MLSEKPWRKLDRDRRRERIHGIIGSCGRQEAEPKPKTIGEFRESPTKATEIAGLKRSRLKSDARR